MSVEFYSYPFSFDNQKLVLSYLHPYQPYRSLVLFYKIGSGKTYLSACLAHIYLTEGYNVLYLSSSLNSINSFVFEYNKVIIDFRFKSKIKNIDLMSFISFYKHNITKDYGLIIMDEIHNLRENALKYNTIKSKLDSFTLSKLLIITATPIIDNINEIDSIIKLCNEVPKILFSDYNDYISIKNINDIPVTLEYVGTKTKNGILFLSTMKGIQLQNYNKITGDTLFTKSRQAAISSSYEYNKDIPLEDQSCKIDKLVSTLKNELTLIFCFYIKRGINFLKQVLVHLGYLEWYPRIKMPGKKFAIISGKTKDEQTREILEVFNSISNINGDDIQILIGSSVLNESITLYRVSQIHILSPFWNYGYIQQSIGRAIRHNSHIHSSKDKIQIYLHSCTNSIDMKMWDITYYKQKFIENKLESERSNQNTIIKSTTFNYPNPDNKLIHKVDNEVWDFTNCFDSNKYIISWCKIYYEKAICYDLIKKEKIYISVPSNKFIIHEPLPDGYTIWRSCIDDRLRLSYIDKSIKNKYIKRGKLLSNVNTKLIEKELGCTNLVEFLKENNRYFDKQIEHVL